jgi:transcription initiation factor TFIIB
LQKEIFDKCGIDHCTKGPLVTDNSTGEILCLTCGQVLAEKTEDTGPEFRTYTLEQFNSRTRSGAGSSLTIHDRGLSTTIDHGNKDASGNSLSSHTKNTFSRLRIWDNRSKSGPTEQNLRKAFNLLNTIKSQLVIPDSTMEESAYIYRKAVAMKMTRGRSIDSVLCASLYAACRKAGIPRTLREIANVANVRKKDLTKAYRLLIRSLDLKIEPFDPSDFVTRVSSMIGTGEKTRRDALDILKKAEVKGLCTGKHPMVLVSAAVYLAAIANCENKTQKNIAKAAGITNISIRNISKLFASRLDLSHYQK